MMKFIREMDAPTEREKFEFQKQSRAIETQKWVQTQVNKEADWLLDHGKNLASAIENASPAELKILQPEFQQTNMALQRLRGYGTGLSPKTHAQMAMLETNSKKIQWEMNNGKLGPPPRANDERYQLDGGLNETAYVTDLHQYNIKKRSFDGFVYGDAARMDIPNSYPLPTADVIKGAEGGQDQVVPRIAIFDKGSNMPRIDNVLNLIGGPEAAKGLGTTWAAIQAQGMRHYMGTPSLVESNGKQYRVTNYLDFTQGGKVVTDTVPLGNVPKDASATSASGKTMQAFKAAYNSFGVANPVNDAHAKVVANILDKSTNLLDVSTIHGAKDLKKKIVAALDDPAVATAEGVFAKTAAFWNPFNRLFWSTDRVMQEAIAPIILDHIERDVQPYMEPGTVALFQPFTDNGVQVTPVTSDDPGEAIAPFGGAAIGGAIAGPPGAAAGFAAGLPFWKWGGLRPFTPNYMPGPMGIGRINFVEVDDFKELPDATGQNKLKFWYKGDRVFNNWGQNIPGMNIDQVAEFLSRVDLTKVPLSEVFRKMGAQ